MAQIPSMPDRMRERAKELGDIAATMGLDMLSRSIESAVEDRLDHKRVGVLVIGEINHGKSSLVNALLGDTIVPVGVTPTTATVIRLRRGDEPGVFLSDASGRRELEQVQLDATARAKGDADLEVVHDRPALPASIELVDTPGFNDIDQLRSARARGGLPRADVLILALDATQALTRTELSLLQEALDAVGGFEGGAVLGVALNRIDLVDASEHAAVRAHVEDSLRKALGQSPEIFMTNAKLASKDPADASLGVREIGRLRAWLRAVAADRDRLLPARTRAVLLRYTQALAFNAAVQRRALRLEADALDEEIDAVEKAMAEHAIDLGQLRAMIQERAAQIVAESRARSQQAREALEAQSLEHISSANLEDLTGVVPGAIEDAFLAHVRKESQRVREALDELTREALRTHGDLARRRLIEATLHLGFRGPAIYVEPPSLAIEAGLVALGIVGTAVMAFGNMLSGMIMTVASPLTTVALRELSVRQARARAKSELPTALMQTFGALSPSVESAVESYCDSLIEHLNVAAGQLGEQLRASLTHAKARRADPDAATSIDRIRERIAGIRGALEAVEIPPAERPDLLH